MIGRCQKCDAVYYGKELSVTGRLVMCRVATDLPCCAALYRTRPYLNSVLICWCTNLVVSFDFERIRHTCSEIYVVTSFFLRVVHQRKSGLGRVIVDFSRPHPLDTHPVGLWRSDEAVAEAAAYTKHNKHKRRTAMPSAGFEPTIQAVWRQQTYALDRTATGIGTYLLRIYV